MREKRKHDASYLNILSLKYIISEFSLETSKLLYLQGCQIENFEIFQSQYQIKYRPWQFQTTFNGTIISPRLIQTSVFDQSG